MHIRMDTPTHCLEPRKEYGSVKRSARADKQSVRRNTGADHQFTLSSVSCHDGEASFMKLISDQNYWNLESKYADHINLFASPEVEGRYCLVLPLPITYSPLLYSSGQELNQLSSPLLSNPYSLQQVVDPSGLPSAPCHTLHLSTLMQIKSKYGSKVLNLLCSISDCSLVM